MNSKALAFVVKTQGSWTCDALSEYRDSLTQSDGFETSLNTALAVFSSGPAKIFFCNGSACQKRRRFEASLLSSLEELQTIQVQSHLTDCQGPCKFAPIATLRVGTRSTMFAEFPQIKDLEKIVDFAVRATNAKTLLVDVGASLPFHFDPSHEEGPSSNRLSPVEFLLGHFVGSGHCPSKNYKFTKEVMGAWEVGGRFLALRMAATYELKSGLKDMHQALVILGLDPENGEWIGRAFTDGGLLKDFHVTLDDGRIIFPESIPHGSEAKNARKVLTPTVQGYIEVLELDYDGSGVYLPYYRVELSLQSAHGPDTLYPLRQ